MITPILQQTSALRIEHELADLSRRAVMYNLPVLSLREFMEIETNLEFVPHSLTSIMASHQDIATQVMQQVRPIEQFKKYMKLGAYPFYQESEQRYSQKLLEVVNTTIDSDLCHLYNIEPLKLDKLLLDNPNLFYALCAEPNVGSLRESFFVSQMSHQYQLHYHDQGDFIIDDTWVCEIGGAGKTLKQIADIERAFLVVDDTVIGSQRRIPLWLFGMMY